MPADPSPSDRLAEIARLPTVEAVADAVARACAEIAGWGSGLLTIGFEGGELVGGYNLAPDELAHFRATSHRASLHERQVIRRRLRERAFPGTRIAFVPHDQVDFSAFSTPEERRRPGGDWHPDDVLFVMVPGADGTDIGVLTMDPPGDGRVPTTDTLEPLRRVEAFLAAAGPLVESRLLRERLAWTEAQLAQAQKLDLLGRLACEVAHDVNNLLSTISGFVELARSGDGRRTAHLDGVLEACRRGGALTHRILDFGRPPGAPARLELSALVDELRELLDQAVRPEHRIDYVLHPEPLEVDAEAVQVTQILLNLVVNAREALPSGGTIRIRTLPYQERASTFVTLEVADDGAGMDEATAARAFEPFFTTRPGGTGLGLATVRRIVAKLGGRTEIESRPAEGTVVRVRLPPAT